MILYSHYQFAQCDICISLPESLALHAELGAPLRGNFHGHPVRRHKWHAPAGEAGNMKWAHSIAGSHSHTADRIDKGHRGESEGGVHGALRSATIAIEPAVITLEAI